MKCPQERLPEQLLTEILEWQRKIKEDKAAARTRECTVWVIENADTLSDRRYQEHLNELSYPYKYSLTCHD